jgi:hypothetical protein
LRVEKFTFEMHPRTRTASVYSSDVVKIEGDREQAVKITMNEPLRHGGYTLYQTSYGPQGVLPGQPAYTVFAVVRNPSDQWPKWACYVIAIGLLWQFGAKLFRHVRSQQVRAVEPVAAAAPHTPRPKPAAAPSQQVARTHP